MDRRDRMAMGPCTPPHTIDQNRMRLTFQTENEEGYEVDLELPFRFEVCGTCDGRGQHVNPSIDAHGITGDEWAEWGDEDRETYMSGGYDVDCYECHGARVVPEVDREHADPAALKAWDADCESLADSARCEAAERRYGA